jgi:hypothetical protein
MEISSALAMIRMLSAAAVTFVKIEEASFAKRLKSSYRTL